eukprot:INCI8319.1.p1 GENE.INCI8319.1~~INCI8319.1.p1  ORF type:complete len:1365 (+),score=193.96 INCI8319.1:715-4809(+)
MARSLPVLRAKKNILTAATFLDDADDSVQQESYDIAPILGGDTPDDELQPEKFGTWDGVWARCMANIFGVIMFLRTGWVVGQAGIGLSCVIILLSGFITTLTTMSMSAIATNGHVKGGGAYFLISRSVGPSLGGSIGILFTLGLTLGVALYTIGFCETMVSQLGVASTGGTCLTCYGANLFNNSAEEEVLSQYLNETTCCNSCDEVVDAYDLRHWSYETDNFIQCQGIPIVIVPQPVPILQLAESYVDNVRIWGVIVNAVLLIMILIGIGWIVRLQAVFLAIIIVSMVSVVIGGAVGPDHWLHSWNNDFTLAPGFTGMGNPTCTNTVPNVTSTSCNDFDDWQFVFDSTQLRCSDFNSSGSFNHLCNDTSNTIFGTFNSSCTSVQEACCDCGGGSESRNFTEICSEFVDNFFANLGPQFTCDGPSENFYNGSPGSCWDFFTVFGIFFPAVTGIMAGANISNLLQKPAVNLPVGTFHSIAWSTVGYLVLAIVVGASATRAELIGNYFLMQYMDITIFLVPLGVYCATFSSALASLVGAPQLLAAVAADKLIPFLNVFAVTHHRVGFCPRRSRRTGRVVFCCRRAPYVTDGLHVFFARRVKLYIYRHVLNDVVELSGLERKVLKEIDLPRFSDRDTLLEHIQSLRSMKGPACALSCLDTKMQPAKLKAALLDSLVSLRRLPVHYAAQVQALLDHLDVNLAHYDSARCTDEELRRLLPTHTSDGSHAPVLKRIINSAFVPAEMVKLSLEAFVRRAAGSTDHVSSSPSGATSAKAVEVEMVESGAREVKGVFSEDELEGVEFDAAAWSRFDALNCVRTITGENDYDGFLPVQYGFRLMEGDPIIGYFLMFFLGTGCVLIGTLNVVAPLISMFFLITYGMVNFACSLQVFSKNPGWRPAYKFYHWSMSLLGGLLCLAAMLIMEWISSIIAILLAIVIAIAIYASPHEDTVGNWGDATEAAKHMAIRRNLLGLRTSKYHPKNFRPSYLMIFPEHPKKKTRNITRVAYTLRKGFGTTHIGVVNVTDDMHQDLLARQQQDNAGFFKMFDDDERRKEIVEERVKARCVKEGIESPSPEALAALRQEEDRLEKRAHDSCTWWMQESRRSKDRMFALMDYVNASTFRSGACQFMQICGVGPLRPNTLLLDFTPSAHLDTTTEVNANVERIFYSIQDALRMRMSVVIARLDTHDINFYSPQVRPHRKHGCDAWWVMDDGGFSLMIPHLLMQSRYWTTVVKDCDVKTRYCALNNAKLSGVVDAENRHKNMLASFRLDWPVEVLSLGRQEMSEDDDRRTSNGPRMRLITDLEEVAKPAIARYNAIAYAENLGDQDITEEQRQMMYRWLAVAVVMQAESVNSHMVCGTLPFTRRFVGRGV